MARPAPGAAGCLSPTSPDFTHAQVALRFAPAEAVRASGVALFVFQRAPVMTTRASAKAWEPSGQTRHVGSGLGPSRTAGDRIRPAGNSPSSTLDWDVMASRILAILLVIKRERRTFLIKAARRGISMEQLTAAVIAGAVVRFLQDRVLRKNANHEAKAKNQKSKS